MKKKEFKDYYKILGLEFGATSEEVKSRFRELAKVYHPDVSKNSDDMDFKIILEAYKILISPEKRKEYDRIYLENLSNGVIQHQKEEDIGLIEPKRIEYRMSLLNISKAGFKLKPRKFSRQDYLEEIGEDIVITLTDKEIKNGAIAQISIPARSVCNVCYGNNRNCYLCDGRGYITTTEKINIFIPPGTQHLSSVTIETKKFKNRKIISFSMKEIIIKFKWQSMEGLE